MIWCTDCRLTSVRAFPSDRPQPSEQRGSVRGRRTIARSVRAPSSCVGWLRVRGVRSSPLRHSSLRSIGLFDHRRGASEPEAEQRSARRTRRPNARRTRPPLRASQRYRRARPCASRSSCVCLLPPRCSAHQAASRPFEMRRRIGVYGHEKDCSRVPSLPFRPTAHAVPCSKPPCLPERAGASPHPVLPRRTVRSMLRPHPHPHPPRPLLRWTRTRRTS